MCIGGYSLALYLALEYRRPSPLWVKPSSTAGLGESGHRSEWGRKGVVAREGASVNQTTGQMRAFGAWSLPARPCGKWDAHKKVSAQWAPALRSLGIFLSCLST